MSRTFPGLKHPLCFRPNTSDVDVLFGTIVREEYATSRFPQEPVKVIIDAGANIGDMTCWFLSRFPNAVVLALEPDPETFGVLVENCKSYGDRARPFQMALWSEDGPLRFSARTDCPSASALSQNGAICDGISIPSLLRAAGLQDAAIDIFKCDIEGAERQVFRENSIDWLPRTQMMIIETHGDSAEKIVLSAAISAGFIHGRRKWLHVFSKPSA